MVEPGQANLEADGPLLERARETGILAGALRAAAQGHGGVSIVEGPAGIGKTRLLALAGERGAAPDMDVLWARGAELERDYAWGVVRQLFEPWLLKQEPAVRQRALAGPAAPASTMLGLSGGEEARDAFAVVHGLYWLVVNVAEEQPLALIVDDLQWVDDASVSWLAYLAGRLDQLPVALVVALRRPDPAADRALLGQVTSKPQTRVLRLAPLSAEATRDLVSARSGLPSDPALASACHEASGGNPFLLRALLDDLSEFDTDAPADPRVVGALRPDEITRSVLLRLGRLSAEARGVCLAFAVLGGAATTTRAAALAQVSDADAAAAAAALATAGILTDTAPPAFVHPVVHSVVLGDMPAPVRAQWHARAAVVLRRTGGGLQEIAGQLLQAEPAADDQASATLLQAGSVALSSGASQEAVIMLERAIREPPPRSQFTAVQRRLGLALLQTQGAVGLTALRAAAESALDPRERIEVGLELAHALEGLSRNVEATAVYEQALREPSLGSGPLRHTLEAGLAAAAAQNLSTLPRAVEILSAAFANPDAAVPVMRAVMALAVTAAGASEGVELAEAALSGDELFDADTSIAVGLAIAPLVWGDRLDAARSAWDQVIARARTHGAPLRYAFGVTFRSDVHLRAGRLADAEADARAGLGVPERMWSSSVPVDTPALLAEALIQRGALDEADVLLDSAGPASALSGYQGNNLVLMARGRLRLAQGRTTQAAKDLLELGRRCEAFTLRNPAAVPWRSHAALAVHQTDPHRAVTLADEEVELARAFGAPRALGISLRACGLVRQGHKSVDLLRESVEVLGSSCAALELARALVDLGAAERRAGERIGARRRLAEGLDAAAACGALPLAARARTELVAAGARPRRDRITSRDALTASELRTARMASEGKTNREIAEVLWVTLSTVEAHLTRVYRKLGVSKRTDLGKALEDALTPD